MTAVSRGSFLAGGAAALAFPRAAGAALHARQFHTDTAGSTMDVALRALWAGVRDDTSGALVVDVQPQNGGIAGGDPQALAMVQDGSLEFFTVNGALLGNVVPLASYQSLPFVYRDRAQVYRIVDGACGRALVDACAASRVAAFAGAIFDNGFRELTTSRAPVHTVSDVDGMNWRTPAAPILQAFVRALGAVPKSVNFNGLAAALAAGTVQAQDNPLAFIAGLDLDKELPYVNVTNHMWAGFNFIANRAFYAGLPKAVRRSIRRRLALAVASQRAAQTRLESALPAKLRARGLTFTDTDTSGFRAKLAGFYEPWTAAYGPAFCRTLEASLGYPIAATT